MVDNGAISLGGGGGAGGIDQLTGDVTAGPGTGSQVASLADVGTAETVGDAGHYPIVTTDAKGRVTTMTAQAVPADVPLATVTAAGDLIVGTGAGAVTRLPIGANGDVLTVAAGALGYAAPASGGVDLLQFFQSTLPSSSQWCGVTYGAGVFVAIAANSTATAYSTNGGVTWTAGGALPSSSIWNALAFGNNAFVAVATGSTAGAYSTNHGVTWTATTLPNALGYTAIAFGNNTFVAVINGANAAAYSTNNGVTWTAVSLPATGASSWVAIAFGNNTFVAVEALSAVGAYSTNNGVSWTAVSLPNAGGYSAVAFGNSTFVAVGYGTSSYAAYSTNNGVAWTAVSLPATGASSWVAIAFGNSTFVAVTGSTTAAAYSTDNGVTWEPVTTPAVASVGLYSLTSGGGAFVGTPNGSATGVYTQVVGVTGPGAPVVSNPAVTSGTAFVPSSTSNSTVYFQVNATVAGSYTITMGPSAAGTDYTIATGVAMLVNSDDLVTLVVPMGWSVVLTLTSVTLASTTVVAM